MRRGISYILVAVMMVSLVCPGFVEAMGHTISVDGDNSDWRSADVHSISEGDSDKWGVCSDGNYVYFYFHQNSGNEWNCSIPNIKITKDGDEGWSNSQESGWGKKAGLVFAYANRQYEVKDAHWGSVSGSRDGVSLNESNRPEVVEFAVPRSYFPEGAFTLSCGGATVASSAFLDEEEPEEQAEEEEQESKEEQKEEEQQATDEKDESDKQEEENTDVQTGDKVGSVAGVYNGITIDGKFDDWSSIQHYGYQTTGWRKALEEYAVIWDGDGVYIYLKEGTEYDGVIQAVSAHGTGHFAIQTDLGRLTNFNVSGYGKNPVIEQIKGATIAYDDHQYEIRIPSTAIKEYNDTISLIVYNADSGKPNEVLLDGIANIGETGEEDQKVGEFNGIQYDKDFSDWHSYKGVTEIEYSTGGGKGGDAVGALWKDDDNLYGYVQTYYDEGYNRSYQNPYQDFYLDVAGHKIQVGVFETNPAKKEIRNHSGGTFPAVGEYEYTLAPVNAPNGEVNSDWYMGKIFIKVCPNGRTEMEYVMHYEDISKALSKMNINLDPDELREFKAQYYDIGKQWVICAGTSSGPIVGILLCIGATLLGGAGFGLHRRKKGRIA